MDKFPLGGVSRLQGHRLNKELAIQDRDEKQFLPVCDESSTQEDCDGSIAAYV